LSKAAQLDVEVLLGLSGQTLRILGEEPEESSEVRGALDDLDG